MNSLIEGFKAALSRYPCVGHYWVGYSGGLDSTVLLHLLASNGIAVRAVHINHQLSPNADAWQAHCINVAKELGVPITVIPVVVDTREGGVEQAARRARYRVFATLLQAGDQILLAQHGDDQVETFLLRLLRGAGVLGLGAMAESRVLGSGSLLRPLLGFSRAQLEEYAREHKLAWIDDESNVDQRLERNYLRARVVPLLQARWPVRARVARATANLREAAELLGELGGEDLKRCDRRGERFGESACLTALRRLSPARQKNLLRAWLADCGSDMPQAVHLEEALAQAFNAAQDSRVEVKLGGLVVRRFRDRLYLTPPLSTEDALGEWQWSGSTTLALPDGWELSPGDDWPAGNYRVRFRRGGERARPSGRQRSQSLKKLLQELGLEPWLRSRVPLIYRDGELLAVGDLFVSEQGGEGLPCWRYRGLSD